jgi:hypothetical protein
MSFGWALQLAGYVPFDAMTPDPHPGRTPIRPSRRRRRLVSVLAALGSVLTVAAVIATWVAIETTPPGDHPARGIDCGTSDRSQDAVRIIPPGLLQHDNHSWQHRSTVCRPVLNSWCDTFLHPIVDPQAVAWRENYTGGPPERREQVVVYPDTRTSRAAYHSMRLMHESCSDYSEGGIRYEYGEIRTVRLGDAAFLAHETHVSVGGDGQRAGYPRHAHYTLVIRLGTALAIYHDSDSDAALTDGTATAAAMCRYAITGC